MKATLQNRDSRIQLFTKMDGSIENYTSEGAVPTDLSWTVKGNNETRMVTGFAVKKGKTMIPSRDSTTTTARVVASYSVAQRLSSTTWRLPG